MDCFVMWTTSKYLRVDGRRFSGFSRHNRNFTAIVFESRDCGQQPRLGSFYCGWQEQEHKSKLRHGIHASNFSISSRISWVMPLQDHHWRTNGSGTPFSVSQNVNMSGAWSAAHECSTLNSENSRFGCEAM